MLVSTCCDEHVTVQHTEDCSFYVCIKCRLPADGRRLMKTTEIEDATVQSKIAG